MYDERFAPRPVTGMADNRGPPTALTIPPALGDDARSSRLAAWMFLGIVVYCSAQVYFLI
jgi:hypothetical protein